MKTARTIVKVQRPLAWSTDYGDEEPPYLVYDEGRNRLSHQGVPDAVVAALGDDAKGYFEAEWHRGGWSIGRRVADEVW